MANTHPPLILFKGIIMKSIKTLRFTKSIIAIAIAASGISTSGIALTPNQSGTPDDGHICRAGYTAAFNGTSLKCSKTSTIVVNLICADPGISNYVSRVVGSQGSAEGQDICIRDTIVATSTSNIERLIKGTDYVFAKPDKAKIAEKTTARDLEEATAFGGTAGSVDTVGADPVVNTRTSDSKDNASVRLTHFAFPVPTVGIVIGPATPSSAFVPRPLQ
jgi:hypothetical protein